MDIDEIRMQALNHAVGRAAITVGGKEAADIVEEAAVFADFIADGKSSDVAKRRSVKRARKARRK